MKAAGLELALGSRNRGDLREGMGQVTTKWDGSRGQEPGRDDESPPRPDPLRYPGLLQSLCVQ